MNFKSKQFLATVLSALSIGAPACFAGDDEVSEPTLQDITQETYIVKERTGGITITGVDKVILDYVASILKNEPTQFKNFHFIGDFCFACANAKLTASNNSPEVRSFRHKAIRKTFEQWEKDCEMLNRNNESNIRRVTLAGISGIFTKNYDNKDEIKKILKDFLNKICHVNESISSSLVENLVSDEFRLPLRKNMKFARSNETQPSIKELVDYFKPYLV